jgi:hypothetical protein
LYAEGAPNERQQVTITTATGSSKKSQKQVRFRKLKTRKKAEEIATLRREEQRLDQRGILKRSHSMSLMDNQSAPHHYWQSDNKLDHHKSNNFSIHGENPDNIYIKPFLYSQQNQYLPQEQQPV